VNRVYPALWVGILSMAGLVCGGLSAEPFNNAALGSEIRNVVLSTHGGEKHLLLTNVTANVFLFVQPKQAHSVSFLKKLAVLEQDLATKSVRWVALVSDRASKEEVLQMIHETGVKMPVLIDEGDRLYAELGVTLRPTVGIADLNHRLIGYEPFRSVQYIEILRARILGALGEMSAKEEEDAVHPPETAKTGDHEAALRRLRLALGCFRSGDMERAQANARKALERDPALASAHGLLGRILLDQGKREEAQQELSRSLALDPAETNALQALRLSGAQPP
jgi:tetratricopeptide (TPR) repeat protein